MYILDMYRYTYERTYKHFMVNTKKLPYLLYMRKYAYNVMSPIVMRHHVVK